MHAPTLEFVIVWIDTSDGVAGVGFAYTVGRGGSAIKALIDDYCAPLLIGRDPTRFEQLWGSLSRDLSRVGRGGIGSPAIAAIDIAVWDLLGKLRGEPLHRMLGGARTSATVYASGIDAHLSPSELQERLAGVVQSGYRAVKIKVGLPQARADVERVAAAREAIGEDVLLLVDANCRWRLDEALARVASFERFGVAWVEEPLGVDDLDGHCRLRSAVEIPIAIGESLHDPEAFLRYLRADAVDVLQPDVVRVGGITPWLKIAHMAEAWGKPVAPHYLAELSIHLVCAITNGMMLEEVGGGGLAEIGLARDRITISDGEAIPSSKPGHGIELESDTITDAEREVTTTMAGAADASEPTRSAV